MEELGVAITKFELPNSAAFLPVRFFVVKQVENVPPQDVSEVCFWHRQPPTLLKTINLQESFITVINQHSMLGYCLTLFQIIPEGFELFT